MTTQTAEVFVKLYKEFGVMVVANVSYEVYGGYAPATYHHPAEYPEVEAVGLESFEIDECLYDEDPDPVALKKAVEEAVFSGAVNEQLWDAAETAAKLAREDRECAMYDEWRERRYAD